MSLQVEKLTIKRQAKTIVNEISLKVSDKQFVGIIGPNGCGKSTLLMGVAGILPFKAKVIKLDELNLMTTKTKETAQHLSVVGQFNEVNFDLKVEDMVLLGRTPYKKMMEGNTTEDQNYVDEALEKTELTAYRHRNFLSLSGGEKQRVIIARALCQQTDYMILDEPTNHLDVNHQLSLLNELKKIECGILTALHNLETAAQYCDYIYAMKDGEIVAEGTPEVVLTESVVSELYNVPCHIYRNPIDQGLNFYFKLEE